jgi:ankyrin repeat protein
MIKGFLFGHDLNIMETEGAGDHSPSGLRRRRAKTRSSSGRGSDARGRNRFIFLLALPLLAFLALFSTCSSPAAKAKDELARRGVPFSESAFLERVKAGDRDNVRLFLSAGMSADAGEAGYTALLEAARRGYGEIVLDLIGAGADVRAKDPYGVTAVMFSLIAGSGEAALGLMARGADVNARDVDGRTALIEALTTENEISPEIIQELIRKGADVNVRIAGGITPLMIAVSYDPAVVRMLVEAGADVNAVDDGGASVLRRARESPENAAILKEAGAKENASGR